MAGQENMRWVGSWGTTPSVADGIALDGQTVRMIARISIGGGTLRVRLSNAYGTHKLDIGAARFALRDRGADIVPDSDRALTFNGSPSTVIAAGAHVVSDPVDLEAPPLADLAVSVHLPGSLPESFQITGHGNSRQTSYISTVGDHTATTALPVEETTEAYLFVSGIDVLAPAGTGGIVALGDSLTDYNISRVDANTRWPNQLARRLVERGGGRAMGVMNQGIGGTMLTFENEDLNPPPGLPGLYTPEGEAKRVAVNAWIRDGGAFDAVIDFEKALRDPDHPTQMLPIYDCDDHLHPIDAGYLRMGDIIDLSLFD